MDTIEQWPLEKLRSHPENGTIFGNPEEAHEFDDIHASIRKQGILEPIIAKWDGTILAGHVRFACASRLRLATVPVRIHGDFPSYVEEVKFVIRSNTERRHLTPEQIAYAFKRLKAIPRVEGGAKAKHGGDRRSAVADQVAESRHLKTTRAEAASQLNVSRDVAEACETVFTTPGVPDALKASVNAGNVAPTSAAKEIRAEAKRQGGSIKNPAALISLTERHREVRSPPADGHEDRLADQARRFHEAYARLVKAYREMDSTLTSLPLRTLLGPSEHHEYRGILRDIIARASAEVQQVEGPDAFRKQMTLAVIEGGRS